MHKPVFTFEYRIFTAVQLDFAHGGQRILKLDSCISRNNASWHNLASLLFGGNHICSEFEGNKRSRFWKGKHNLLCCVCLRTCVHPANCHVQLWAGFNEEKHDAALKEPKFFLLKVKHVKVLIFHNSFRFKQTVNKLDQNLCFFIQTQPGNSESVCQFHFIVINEYSYI